MCIQFCVTDVIELITDIDTGLTVYKFCTRLGQ